MTFSGKSAIVTGAAGGMGLAIAQGLVSAGVSVTAIDIKPQPSALQDAGPALRYLEGDLTDDEIDLKTMVHTTRHAVPLMKRSKGGAMVHIASTQALRGDDKPQDAYQASKAAILSLSKSLAIQFAANRIRSNCVVPGPCQSPMQSRWEENPSLKEATAGVIPLGRVGDPEDIANAVLFLLSDQASYITGTELIVDGGLTARP